ncbi:MAG: LamG domain-containing protein [Planctomycetes bacterium]|nr:LamG domain-containing protein [Planctomycetota bacterium]
MCRRMLFLVSFVWVLSMAGNASADLMALWRFNEAGGDTVEDSSGNGNTGIIEDAHWVDGMDGAALQFDGQTAHVIVPDSPSLHSETGDITIAAWIKVASDPKSWSDAGPMVFKQYAYQWNVNSNGALWFGIWGARLESRGTYDFSEHIEEWHHATLTFEGSTRIARIYVDGELNIEGTVGEAVDPTPDELYIGFKGDGGTYFDGVIDDVRIYDHTLNAAEILAAMEGIEFDGEPAAESPTIIWVSDFFDDNGDGVPDDQSWVDLLEAQGYTVDYTSNIGASGVSLGYGYWSTLDDDKIAALNAADLIIVSRNSNSGDYANGDESTQWNSVTTPIILQAMHIVRSNRWQWLDTTTLRNLPGFAADILAADHSIFDGVVPSAQVLDGTVELTTFPEITGVGVGNGTLIAKVPVPDADVAWIVEWEAGVEFYDGSGQIAGGQRMIFPAGTQESGGVIGRGEYNLTPEGEMIFLNAVNYMLGISELEQVDPGTDVLVAYYPLENDVSDHSGNGNDGIVEGDPTYVGGPAGYGMAMEFDGDDYVDTGNTEDLAEWTIACWTMSPSAPSGDPSSASGPVHRERNYQFNWNHQNNIPRGSVAVRSAGGWHAASLGTLKADTWYHLTGTYDGDELKAYKDGVLITTNDAPSGPPLSESGTLKLGKHATAEQYFTGTVDEAIVYSRVLSVGEIRYLAGGANIIVVTEAIDWDMDGLRDDHSLESFLVSEGHSVDVRPDYWKMLTPDKIDELNAADLIIFSRLNWSKNYDDGNETIQWNSLKTPLLQMSAWFVTNTRWNWINSDVKQRTPLIYAEAVDPYHPIFRGVSLTTFDPSNPDSPTNVVQMVDPLIGTGLTSFIQTTNMGNGHLIAKPVQAGMGWIAEWDVGVEFFEGAGQYTGGRRMLFCAGTQETRSVDPDTQEEMTTAQGELNLTGEGLQMFRNAIDYFLNPEFADLLSTECIVAHWKLDEIEGGIAYDSVGDNDGILYGNPIWQPMGGMLGGALEFDGDNDYVDCGTFNPSEATGQLSICLWAKWNGLNGRYQGLIGKRNSWNVNNMMWQLETSRHISGNVMFEREGYAGVAGGILTEGDWEHWCVTFDGATAIIYRMGEEVNRGAFSFGSKTDAQVVLGGSNAANPFNGALDDIRIYDCALDENQIKSLISAPPSLN